MAERTYEALGEGWQRGLDLLHCIIVFHLCIVHFNQRSCHGVDAALTLTLIWCCGVGERIEGIHDCVCGCLLWLESVRVFLLWVFMNVVHATHESLKMGLWATYNLTVCLLLVWNSFRLRCWEKTSAFGRGMIEVAELWRSGLIRNEDGISLEKIELISIDLCGRSKSQC